ncbi:protein disulfide oxidoreductase [Mycobacterium sp. NPDC003449]
MPKDSPMKLRFAAALAALAVVLAACGSQSAAAPASPAQLQFNATTLDGADFVGASLLGKPAVLWFWAPWCPNCQREAPQVARAAADNPGVTFVGVAAQDQVPAMKEFVDKYSVGGFTQLADTDAAVWARFGVTYQPAYAFIGSDGNIDTVKSGLSESELTERVTSLADR